MVSPTFTSREVLMPEMIYPTSPVRSSARGIISIFSTPISSASYSLPVLKNFTLSPLRITPFSILKYAMIPRKELNTESKIKACSGASSSPVGCGIRSTTAFNISSTPIPVLPEARIISSCLQPSRSMISSSTSSGMALAISHLFSTGMISRSCSNAMYRFEIVCACTPCEASTMSSAPSQAAMERDTSYEKSTCPGVSIRFSTYFSPPYSYSIWMAWLLIVIPLSFSRSISSSICPSVTWMVFVNSNKRSAKVDFPWSICAIMQKLRIFFIFVT